MEAILIAPEQVTNPDNSIFWDDNWYSTHQDKILGIPETVSGRFGEVTTYRGTINDLDKIDVNLDFASDYPDNSGPAISVIENQNLVAESFEPETQTIIERAVNSATQNSYETPVTDSEEVQSFREVYESYNPGILKDELEAYIWYKSKIGMPLSRQWARLVSNDVPEGQDRKPFKYIVDESKIDFWFKKGIVSYMDGEFIPSVLYNSGNIYDRKAQLAKDKEDIIDKYGIQAYETQEKSWQQAYSKKYASRITLTGNMDSGLILSPLSEFCRKFMVKTIEMMPEDSPFKIKMGSPSSPRPGQPDFINDFNTHESNKTDFDELSLFNAFGYWMIRTTPSLLEDITISDIVLYYLYQKNPRDKLIKKDTDPEIYEKAQAKLKKVKNASKKEGERLFQVFLKEQLTPNDQIRLETQWNTKYNNYVPVDFDKIPVAFTMCKNYKGYPEKLKAEKREAVAFIMNEGAGCLAFDVGVGKTAASIFIISAFIDAGYCSRPFLCVPNQVYKQFISEIKAFAPHIPVIEGYNLSPEYVENFVGPDGNIEEVPEGTITVLTYEGLERIGFNAETGNRLMSSLYDILNQGVGDENENKSSKTRHAFKDRLETIMGRSKTGTLYNIEDFGFDFGCYDEAHAMKKVFTSVKGETEEGKNKGKIKYKINSGSPSTRALKGFMLNQYILGKNHNRNVLLLTATPFTNSPLEIFSMLSMIAYKNLQDTDLNNLNAFFDTFIRVSDELVINSRLQPIFKEIVLGFNNLPALQSLIRRYINHKTGEDVGVKRPNKYVLPMKGKLENGVHMALDHSDRIDTYISMTETQRAMMDQILNYVETGEDIKVIGNLDETPDEDSEENLEEENVEYAGLDDADKLAIRILKGIDYSRSLALSPYLFSLSGMTNPTYKQFIETSPKLTYIMECIRSVKNYHNAHRTPVSGQVIFLNRGVQYFDLVKEYLVKEVGYKEHEIGIIKSGLPKQGKRSKEYVKNLFNGEIYDETSKTFEKIPDYQRIKVIIGSSTIKEGINLQRYGTCLYNGYIEYNPTDIQQLEGRIWRQGNLYDAVRIVNPLMIDSADIFLFQKLQEKTSRLNNLWSSTGKDVLNLEEFNPEEIKYDLIKNPYVIARLRSIDERKELASKRLSLERNINIADQIIQDANSIRYNLDRAESTLKPYRDFERTGNLLDDAKEAVRMINDVFKNRKDREGKKLSYPHELRVATEAQREKMSDIAPLQYKPYWFAGFALNVRDLSKIQATFLAGHGIHTDFNDMDEVKSFRDNQQMQLNDIDTQEEFINSPENLDRLAQEEIIRKQENQISYTTVEESVLNFATLNYLLDSNKVILSKLTGAASCPPVDEEGNRLIDADSLKVLDQCIDKLPQTKEQHFTEKEGYDEDRKALHESIIEKVFKGVKCVTRKEQPICVLTGGAPGSGKTTWLRNNASYLLKDSVFHLDADEIRSMLPEYKGWNAHITHEETKDIVNEILNHIGDVSCRYDFIYDGTMNTANKYFSLIKEIKKLGYKIFIVFMVIPEEESIKRALARYQRKGRYVPVSVIKDFFAPLPDPINKSRGQYSLDQLKPLVDGYVVVDSLTGNIIEQGGESLPENRVYRGNLKLDFGPFKQLPNEKENENEKESGQTDKEALKEEIDSLRLSLDFLSGDEKTEAQSILESLELSLKFL